MPARTITTIYDWNLRGMSLTRFLKKEKYLKQMENSRVFYVVKPNSEDVIKIGVSGENDGRGWARFMEYRLYYGDSTKGNPCLGMKVHYVGKTKYNPLVENKNSLIHKLELHVIREFKKRDIIARGRERTYAKLDEVKDIVFEYLQDDKPVDVETDVRKSTRSTAGKNPKYDVPLFETDVRRSTRSTAPFFQFI